MEQHDKEEVADRTNEVTRLSRHSPDLELVAVAADLVEILGFVEPQLLLQVVPTMVVVEEEIVVGGD